MKKDKEVIIYGAGAYASVVYRYLWMTGKKDRVSSFVVTDIENQKTELYGIPVKTFEKMKAECMSASVILAIKESKQIEEMLRQQGISSIYTVMPDDIEAIRLKWHNYLEKLPIRRNKLVFICFAGKGYECNCKYIAEELLKTDRELDIVWGVSQKKLYHFPEGIREVENNSPEYEEEVFSAAVMISNNDNAPLQKRKELYFINTWHGTGPFKKVNASIDVNAHNWEWLRKMKKIYNQTDLYVSNSADNSEMFRQSFLYDGEILECGSPRNDILFRSDIDVRNQVCNRLHIAPQKKIVLYAPTFRDDEGSTFARYDLNMERVLQALRIRFGQECVLLYRFHHKLRKYRNFENFYSFGINVTDYPDVMELIVASDVLIGDYSSIMWDFSLQRRPVFLYHNDISEYIDERDFYWPVERWPYVKAHTNDEMCEKIVSFDEKEYLEALERFFKEDPSYDDGQASKCVVERILDVMEYPEKYGKR